MSEPKGNKNLVWINTPFSLTKLDKQYTLLQQNILMVASSHLQKYVEEYFTRVSSSLFLKTSWKHPC